jgi:hypothetical protein
MPTLLTREDLRPRAEVLASVHTPPFLHRLPRIPRKRDDRRTRASTRWQPRTAGVGVRQETGRRLDHADHERGAAHAAGCSAPTFAGTAVALLFWWWSRTRACCHGPGTPRARSVACRRPSGICWDHGRRRRAVGATQARPRAGPGDHHRRAWLASASSARRWWSPACWCRGRRSASTAGPSWPPPRPRRSCGPSTGRRPTSSSRSGLGRPAVGRLARPAGRARGPGAGADRCLPAGDPGRHHHHRHRLGRPERRQLA